MGGRQSSQRLEREGEGGVKACAIARGKQGGRSERAQGEARKLGGRRTKELGGVRGVSGRSARLRQRELHVPGSGWHIHHQIVELSPQRPTEQLLHNRGHLEGDRARGRRSELSFSHQF